MYEMLFETFDGLFKCLHRQGRRLEELEARVLELEKRLPARTAAQTRHYGVVLPGVELRQPCCGADRDEASLTTSDRQAVNCPDCTAVLRYERTLKLAPANTPEGEYEKAEVTELMEGTPARLDDCPDCHHSLEGHLGPLGECDVLDCGCEIAPAEAYLNPQDDPQR